MSSPGPVMEILNNPFLLSLFFLLPVSGRAPSACACRGKRIPLPGSLEGLEHCRALGQSWCLGARRAGGTYMSF